MSTLHRIRTRVVSLSLLLALAGCGGGASLFIGTDGTRNDPPSVSLVASATSAATGDTLRLVAAAVDDDGINVVEFYRLESNGTSTFLGNDNSAPYEWSYRVPSDATVEVRFFARAFDTDKDSADSAVVSVGVTRP